ncbi:MAG: M20/M25/M40 family metallo-hydrolase [Mycetocola sp.]
MTAQPTDGTVTDRLREDLSRLLSIPSVSFDVERHGDVHRAAELVRESFERVGVTSRVVAADGGLPAVIGHKQGPAGAPTVLLYAHHDVQPARVDDGWTCEPFGLTERGERWYGRGVSDDKGAIALHLEVLRQFGDDLPVSIAILIEGEEEIASPTLGALIEQNHDALRSDVIIAPDAVNAGFRVPSLTTSLRGVLNLRIDIATAERAVHSGVYGGAVPDSLGVLVRLLASLSDENGSVAVAGLEDDGITRVHQHPPLAEDFRRSAGVRDGIVLTGEDDLARQTLDRASVTVIGIDAPSNEQAGHVLLPSASATVSFRLPPELDPVSARDAIESHISRTVPAGVNVDVSTVSIAAGWRAEQSSPTRAAAAKALADAFSSEPQLIGAGGTVPFVSHLARALPDAEIFVTAIQDLDSRAHGPDESVDVPTLRAAVRAEVQLIRNLGAGADA